MLTGVIFGAIAIAWIAYLVPWLLSRRGQIGALDDETIEQFAGSMRLVRGGNERELSFLRDSGAQVSTPLSRRAARHHIRQASRIAARRRRIGLVLHLVALVAGIVVPFVVPVSHLWTLVPVGMLVGWVALSRISVVTVNRLQFELRAEADASNDEPTVVIHEGSEDETIIVEESERVVEITDQLHETIGSLWDPIPVTPTTYVSRPLLPRSVRTIDLAAPVASAELTTPVTAERAVPDEKSAPTQLPRAVGE